METDMLCLFNLKLCREIARMNDDELWNFLLANEEKIKQFFGPDRTHTTTGALYAYPHGIEHFRKHFLREIENYREGVIFTLTVDFCFEQESMIRLDYWARGGHLDSSDSCDVKTSDEIMPPVKDGTEEANWAKKYFHLLEPHHVEHIIRAMEDNFDKLTVNTREDIDKITAMKKICLDDGYKTAYIYSNFY